ncbi:MAG: sugar phosphate isomerase/epimerase [Clostridia bacterium]|nr:sugar phosphate isomerase/epimerase [Clostridia bacterium]
MKIAMNTGSLMRFYSMEEALTEIKKAGFDSVDMSVQSVLSHPDWSPENYVETAKRTREHADNLGLPITQAHSGGDWDRSAHIASIMGAKSIVVHPRIILPHVGHEDENFLKNMEFYGKLVPIAEKYNIKIAVENMFKWDLKREVINHSSCSRPDEFVRYMDGLEERYGDLFTACLDIGHVALVGTDPCDVIYALGDRLTALHVHDNDLHTDQHTIPGIGAIDFHAVSKALKDIHYQGDYALEVGMKQTKELVPATLDYLAIICRYYANEASN